ncbi:hypothetical protein FRACYDRAFT_235116 [Fragilariopsis cylindrus CCMP1102]|uniref:Uncharacterized protein n=1 Tax=Fragilariopsis cylindrus CCMP1102 TaxID=635003 RepID=A0A1E7FTI9_9STRA|nr:hypothetical protein FRACYDRAFT_235116 [Fragilariopsis cylindrus CCMP1102]|eukprot:OEU21490.1 hypothetical protein FRACYDRAFT_235116 [Fragilariopsis cylindrus CCMP1102]
MSPFSSLLIFLFLFILLLPFFSFLNYPNTKDSDVWISLSTLGTEVYNNVITTTTTIPIPDITTIFSTILFVTVSDMIPFVPCQPLAISLATVYGIYAYPICVLGQTCAGIIAFQSSRLFSNTEKVQNVIENLNEDSNELFQNFQNKILKKQKPKPKNKNDDKSERSKGVIGEVIGTMTKRRSNGNDTTYDDNDDNDTDVDEWTVFLALVGLRFAPFFPFSAGNYLLGGATTVTIRSFIVATILGCLASNAISVLIGMGVGIELLQQQATSQ